jgi:hypothetical protein
MQEEGKEGRDLHSRQILRGRLAKVEFNHHEIGQRVSIFGILQSHRELVG